MPRKYFIIIALWVVAIVAILLLGTDADKLSLLAGFIATISGLFLGLQLSKDANQQAEKDEFKNGLEVLDLELEHNLSALDKHRAGISTTSFNHSVLGTSLINLYLDKPFTSRYGGKVFHQTLLSCRARIDSYLACHSRFEGQAYQNQGLPQEAVNALHDHASQTEFLIVLLRTLITKYKNDPKSLLEEATFTRYGQALELEKIYRTEDLNTAYMRLNEEVAI